MRKQINDYAVWLVLFIIGISCGYFWRYLHDTSNESRAVQMGMDVGQQILIKNLFMEGNMKTRYSIPELNIEIVPIAEGKICIRKK